MGALTCLQWPGIARDPFPSPVCTDEVSRSLPPCHRCLFLQVFNFLFSPFSQPGELPGGSEGTRLPKLVAEGSGLLGGQWGWCQMLGQREVRWGIHGQHGHTWLREGWWKRLLIDSLITGGLVHTRTRTKAIDAVRSIPLGFVASLVLRCAQTWGCAV